MNSKGQGAGGVADAIKQFSNLIHALLTSRKVDKVLEICAGSLRICREKFVSLQTDEAILVLSRIDRNYQTKLLENIEDIFNEEVSTGKTLLNEVDTSLTELQKVLDGVSAKLQENCDKGTESVSRILSCYEDCRALLLFLKLKTNVLRMYLTIPFHEKADSDPFSHSRVFKAEEEDCTYRLKKLELESSIFENGEASNGKLLRVPPTLDEFFETIRLQFGNPEYCKLYTSKGGHVLDLQLLRDDEIVYASKGDPYIPCPSRNYGSPSNQTSSEWIKLNVGGQIFHTSRTTLLNKEPGSVLARMFDQDSKIQPSCQDSSGAYLIDRDPKYFAPLLNYLRTGNLILDPNINPQGVLQEAQFFDLQSCVQVLSSQMVPRDDAALTRRDVVNALISTPNKAALRFQGVNLTEADLSYLDLRNINFKYAKLRKAKLSYCNLSFCNFERADMTGVEMNCAILSGVRMACAIMEGAHCVNCNFQDPSGHHANMEGVNLRNAVLEDSDLTGANLRVANLKNANLKATILRGAILAGADLAMSDLTGSDLHEANLRGANLKDAALELMINPLHMAQTIR